MTIDEFKLTITRLARRLHCSRRMMSIGTQSSLFWTSGAAAPGQADAASRPATADFMAQLQQQAVDDAAPAAKIKATATAGTTGQAASSTYTAIPLTAIGRPAGLAAVPPSSALGKAIAAATPATAQTTYYTQAIAQQSGAAAAAATTAAATATPAAAPTAGEKFLQLAKESPIQRLHDQVLGSMGVTARQATHMTPAQQAKVETAARAKIAASMKKDMGVAGMSTPQGAGAADILASA